MVVSGSVHSATMMSPAAKAAQRLAHAQSRKWAFQAAQIDGFFGHFHSRKLSPDTARALTGSSSGCALDPRISLRQKHRMVSDHPSQRLARLAPLADVLAWIDASVRAVAPGETSVADAAGRSLAADIKIAQALPPKAIALRDGYALQSVWTSDASSYAPAPLPQTPARVDVGDALPAGTDCVAALEHVAIKGERAEALAVVAPGEGILPAGGDAAANQTLLGVGKTLSASDVALLRIANISKVSIRAPRVCVVQTRKDDAIIASVAQMVAAAINKNGGAVVSEARDADAVISIGGTGAGQKDAGVTNLGARRQGGLSWHRSLAGRDSRDWRSERQAGAADARPHRCGTRLLAAAGAAHVRATRGQRIG